MREGYGTIGDLGTGPSRPANGKPTPGTEDWSSGGNGPGNGKANGNSNGKGNAYGKSKERGGALDLLAPPVQQLAPEPEALLLADGGEQGEVQIQGVIGDSDDLVKRNPYRYAGYRYDRETQYYYLRTRYYDGRLGRFLSQDTWAGDVRKPLTLNRHIYAVNNPVNYLDPDGREPVCETEEPSGRFIGCSEPYNNEPAPSPSSQRYTGKAFTVPPDGPSGAQSPNEEQTRFIQYLFDIGEEPDYGPRTRLAVDGLRREHQLPDGSALIDPQTWELLVERFERGLGVDVPDGTVGRTFAQDAYKGNADETGTQNLWNSQGTHSEPTGYGPVRLRDLAVLYGGAVGWDLDTRQAAVILNGRSQIWKLDDCLTYEGGCSVSDGHILIESGDFERNFGVGAYDPTSQSSSTAAASVAAPIGGVATRAAAGSTAAVMCDRRIDHHSNYCNR